jgi:uncharacterized protein YxeA
MKKIIVVVIAVLVIVVAGFIACNRSSTPSKNKEGIMEITGPSDKEEATIDTTTRFTPI